MKQSPSQSMLWRSSDDFRQHLARRVLFGVPHDAHRSTQTFHYIELRDGLLRIISALAMYVGAEVLEDARRGRVIENQNVVRGFQRRDELRARLSRKQRPPFTLQLSHRPVAVHSHHQDVALFFRPLKIANVSDVQQIKTTVGKNNPLPLTAQTRAQSRNFSARDHLVAHELRMASSSSRRVTVAVPLFITTRPPAKFASCAAWRKFAPAAKARVNAAITVSPAPVTSVTWSEPKIGICCGLRCGSKRTIPSRPRVTSKARSHCRRSAFWPSWCSNSRSFPIRFPKAASNSGSLGVAAVTREYFNRS